MHPHHQTLSLIILFTGVNCYHFSVISSLSQMLVSVVVTSCACSGHRGQLHTLQWTAEQEVTLKLPTLEVVFQMVCILSSHIPSGVVLFRVDTSFQGVVLLKVYTSLRGQCCSLNMYILVSVSRFLGYHVLRGPCPLTWNQWFNFYTCSTHKLADIIM